MAYPGLTDWPTSVDGAVTRTDNVDTVFDEDFNYQDSQIRAIQVFLGATGELIGAGAASQGPGGMVSPIADGASAIAFQLVARDNFATSGAKLLSLGDDYDAAPPAYTQKFGVDGAGRLELTPLTLGAAGARGRLAYNDADDNVYRDNGVSWDALGGGGGGNDSLPDIAQWVIVDKTTGSYTEDGTIQFPEDTLANAITVASGLTPTATARVAIKLMPGHYTEDSLDLPSYVYVVGESREACVITQTADTEIIEQTNDHAGYYNVSIERTGSSGGTTGNTGTMTITVDTPTFEQDTLDDAGGSFTSDLVGQPITISGSSVSGNNGTFQVLAVNSPTQLVYKNSDFTKGNVTETLTYSFPTFTPAIDIDGVEDFHFRDVAFDFDERPGILVQGSSDSDVTFARCFMTQTFVTSPYSGKLWRYGLTVSGSGDHQVLLDDVDAEGLGAECSAGTLKVVDTRLHHLAMGEDASLFMYQCEVECPDLPGPYLGGGYMPVDVYEDALRLDTTGQVHVERSTILGWAAQEFGMQGPEWKYCLPVRFDSQPSRSYFSSCHFGNHMPGRTPPTSPYQELPNSIVGTVDSIFRNCAFDYPVEDTIIDTTTSLKLVGPGEMYGSVPDAMKAAAAQAQDDIVIQLTADDAAYASPLGSEWPDGYRTVLDLNGFQLEDYTLVSITSGMDTYRPLATIKNGRLKNCSPLVVSNTSNTADWKVALRNIDMDPTESVSAYIRSGGSDAELIIDDVRGWVGSGTYALWIDHVNPTVTFRNGSYIKGSSGNPAVRFTVACTKFRAARSTFLHGSSGANNPFSDTTSGIVVTLDFCRANSDPTLSPNISASAESAFNIFDNALQDFAG